MGAVNLTPRSVLLRHTTWQSISRPSSWMMSVNVSGNEWGLSVRRRQPVSEIFRTWQSRVENLLLNAAVAPFRTRRRLEFRGSITANPTFSSWVAVRAWVGEVGGLPSKRAGPRRRWMRRDLVQRCSFLSELQIGRLERLRPQRFGADGRR